MKYWEALIYNFFGFHVPKKAKIEGATEFNLDISSDWLLDALLSTRKFCFIILAVGYITIFFCSTFYTELYSSQTFQIVGSVITSMFGAIIFYTLILKDRFSIHVKDKIETLSSKQKTEEK